MALLMVRSCETSDRRGFVKHDVAARPAREVMGRGPLVRLMVSREHLLRRRIGVVSQLPELLNYVSMRFVARNMRW